MSPNDATKSNSDARRNSAARDELTHPGARATLFEGTKITDNAISFLRWTSLSAMATEDVAFICIYKSVMNQDHKRDCL